MVVRKVIQARVNRGRGSYSSSGAPDVRVLGNGNVISDGASVANPTDHTLFISSVVGAGGTTRTYTVENTGTGQLTMSGLTVPSGMEIASGLAATLEAGQTTTFTVRLTDAAPATVSGEISFNTNVGGKNPYNFVVGGEIVPAESFAFYDWGTFSSMTETRRNVSGSTVSGAPVKWKAKFHRGEVTTSRWFDLYREGVLVPSTEWQLGEISTYPDGSMRSAVVRCYGKASWTNNSNSQFELVGKSGSWPTLATNPASGSTPITKVTAGSSVKLSLEDITLLGSPYASTTQPAYGAPNLDSELNRSLADTNTTRKYVDGNICVAWRTWEKLQPPGGGTPDNTVWCLWFCEAWLDPSTGNLLHLMVEPYLNHGWARRQGMLKGFKMKLVNGATTLRDFATAVTLNASNFELSNGAYHFTGTNRTTTFPYSTFDGRVGAAVKVSGDPPSGYVAGKIYQIAAPYGGSDGPFNEPYRHPLMALRTLGTFQSGYGGPGYAEPGTGGSSYTLTVYTYMADKQVLAIRDWQGYEFWPVGGASGRIVANWTRGEKIRRMQTAMIPNGCIEPGPVRSGSFSWFGQTYFHNTGGKNTSFLPNWESIQRYTPGGNTTHEVLLEIGGYYQPGIGGRHKSECSQFFLNVLNDMETNDFRTCQSRAAAEAVSFMVGMNVYDNTLVGGVEAAQVLCINNGPDKVGTQYAGMGTCFPNAISRGGSNQTGIDYAGGQALGGGTVYDESPGAHWVSTSMSGSHVSKEHVFNEALTCSPGYRELTAHLWVRASLNDFPTSASPATLYGANKTWKGTTYYRVSIMATTADGQRRAFIGRSSFLAYALSAPDTEPYRAMLDDIAADNIAFMEMAYDDPDIIGGTAKVLGTPTGEVGGNQQSWHMARINWAAILLAKNSGINCPNTVKFHTAFQRWYFNDPVGGGSGPAFHSTGYFGTDNTYFVQYFDNCLLGSDAAATIANFRVVMQWQRDEASTVVDGSRSTCSIPAGDGIQLRFFTDGATFQWSPPYANTQSTNNFAPDNGDQVYMIVNIASLGFTLLTGLQNMWLYDKTEATHSILLTGGSGNFTEGQTVTDSAGNTATLIWGGGYLRNRYVISKPTPSNFVAGTVTFSGGATRTYNGSILGYGYNYKLSTTDPAVTITPRTWTTATEVRTSCDYMLILYKTRRTGDELGGLVRMDTNNTDQGCSRGWIGHNFAAAQLAATCFGKTETGLANTIDGMSTFYSNCLSGQGVYFWDQSNSGGAWQFHYAYPPGAT